MRTSEGANVHAGRFLHTRFTCPLGKLWLRSPFLNASGHLSPWVLWGPQILLPLHFSCPSQPLPLFRPSRPAILDCFHVLQGSILCLDFRFCAHFLLVQKRMNQQICAQNWKLSHENLTQVSPTCSHSYCLCFQLRQQGCVYLKVCLSRKYSPSAF